MPHSLPDGLDQVRRAVLDEEHLVRAVAAGRRRGSEPPPFRRVELRYVDLKSGRHLQVTEYDQRQAHIRNVALPDVTDTMDSLLAAAYGNWHVTSRDAELQLRVTKRGEALVHRRALAATSAPVPESAHDRAKARSLDVSHPVWGVVGIADSGGAIKPSRVRKHRQVEEFLALLGPKVDDLVASGLVPEPTDARPLRVVDLGCGNAYLTFGAYAFLTSVRGWPVRICGVDVRPDSRERNTARAAELGWSDSLTFVEASNASVEVDAVLGGPPDAVLALHACDTATDEALARAVAWEAPLVLAAPCCHHDIQRQLRSSPTPEPYASLTRHGILKERLADLLTDSFRSSLMGLAGYRVDVVQFVESQHTPRNTLLRAIRGSTPRSAEATDAELAGYLALRDAWGVTPALEGMLGQEAIPVSAGG